MAAMTASLSATDLACRRGDRVLFSALGFTLAAGEALHVAGANGIGKTSLLRILAGLLRPFAGRCEVEGSLGLLDERPALDPELPLGKALDFWAQVDGTGAAAVSEHRKRLGLSNLEDVPLRYLSTGQRKRAAMARLMGQGASIWLLDEPLSGLDSEGIALIGDLIDDHGRAGGVTVLASHQPVELAGLQTLQLEDFAA